MQRRPFSKRFWQDESGAVAATYTLALVPLIAVAGVGMDYARLMGLDSELQNGADQAALAAASQLDGKLGACARAAAAARTLLANETLLATGDNAITIADEAACDAAGSVRFYEDKAKAKPATSDAEANFVEIAVDVRSVDYALLPVTGLMSADNISGVAMAGLGSAICKIPPIMICHPDPTVPFDADARKGQGIMATGHNPGGGKNAGSGGNTTLDPGTKWSPGNFGFLQIPGLDGANAGSKNARLLKALAYATPPTDCIGLDGNRVNTGNPQGLYDAINTRFDIYDFQDKGGGALSSCQGGDCPAAPNVIKDFIKKDTSTKGNACKIAKNGWELPPESKEFKPVITGGWTAGKTSANSRWPWVCRGIIATTHRITAPALAAQAQGASETAIGHGKTTSTRTTPFAPPIGHRSPATRPIFGKSPTPSLSIALRTRNAVRPCAACRAARSGACLVSRS